MPLPASDSSSPSMHIPHLHAAVAEPLAVAAALSQLLVRVDVQLQHLVGSTPPPHTRRFEALSHLCAWVCGWV
jgi:hypothetical protein